MRGKVGLIVAGIAALRITPAYAGKSRRITSSFSSIRDHPRLCGEKIVSNGKSMDALGSPPPMRGKANSTAKFIPWNRITPAYAGKRHLFQNLPPILQDHPRLCGEKLTFFFTSRFPEGSPPPMRGKERKPVLLRQQFGITPAYAGKSGETGWILILIQDHPRLCGEKFRLLHPSEMHLGSPPPMRGKVRYTSSSNCCLGITPAYAGKRLKCPLVRVPF